jgi:hypothetical protein
MLDDSKLNTKETEKLGKNKDLENEISRVWKLRIKIMRVMTGALGTIKMGLDQNRQLLPFHPSDTEILVTLMFTANKICEAQQVTLLSC